MKKQFKVLVFGGRDYKNKRRLFYVLDYVHHRRPITQIIQGLARGADTLALEWAEENGVSCIGFKADWNKWGKSAGYRRNYEMLHTSKPHLAIGFKGGPGTAMMFDLIKSAQLIRKIKLLDMRKKDKMKDRK